MEKKVLGYALLPHDMDAYFYDREFMAELFCTVCGARISNDRRQLPMLMGKKRQIGSTYDGVVLMSSDVAHLFRGQSNAETAAVRTNYGEYYYLKNLTDVVVDLTFQPVHFENACVACGVFGEVSPALPLRLVDDLSFSPSSVKQTQVQFGEGWLRAPIVVIGADVYAALKLSKPSGLDVAEVYSSTTKRWW
jgi:hypothetical protein